MGTASRGRALILSILVLGCSPPDELSRSDIAAVDSVLADYRQAWLDNDTARVMGHLSDEITLFVPGPTGPTIEGKANVRSFWFPQDRRYPIKTFEVTDQQTHGGGAYAVAQGRSLLAWDTVVGDSVLSSSTARSEFLSVLRKESGRWKLYRQMYIMRE